MALKDKKEELLPRQCSDERVLIPGQESHLKIFLFNSNDFKTIKIVK